MVKKRKEVLEQDTWNVKDLFQNFEAWKQEFEAAAHDTALFEKIQSFKGVLHQNSQNVEELLNLYTGFERRLEKIYLYAHLKHDEDVSDIKNKEAYDQIRFFIMRFETETSWIQPEILSFSSEIYNKFLQDQSLSLYHLFLKRILRLKSYTLSEKEEKLFALGGKLFQVPRSVFSLFNNVDLKFPKIIDQEGKEHELTHGLYSFYMQSKDRLLRKNAFEAMHGGFGALENTICELLQGHIQTHVFNIQARGYKDCLEAALFKNEVDPVVYTLLLDSVHENINALHEYVDLRKRLLTLDRIYGYDMYVSCVSDFDFKFSYEEAKDILIEAVAPLGLEYQNILKRGLNEERWVDPFENEAKRSGAYSSGCYDSKPYILMNFQGTLGDLMTLAHEAGHSMHTYYSIKHQPYIYSQYTIFVAEVASTFNEELIFRYLLKRASSVREKLFLIHQKIDGIRATFFRQALFSEFELEIHKLAEKQQPLNASILKEIYKKLNKIYYGPSFEVDDFLAQEYLRIPHFYSNFYVYQYATGISAALSLVDLVLSTNDPEKYLQFLSSGCSQDPISLLKQAGVDMTSKDPTKKLCERFKTLVNDFKELSK